MTSTSVTNNNNKNNNRINNTCYQYRFRLKNHHHHHHHQYTPIQRVRCLSIAGIYGQISQHHKHRHKHRHWIFHHHWHQRILLLLLLLLLIPPSFQCHHHHPLLIRSLVVLKFQSVPVQEEHFLFNSREDPSIPGSMKEGKNNGRPALHQTMHGCIPPYIEEIKSKIITNKNILL